MRGSGLIGRDNERVWLEQAVADALGGRGALVLLAGEAGIGKTRLAEEVAGASDALALRGAASPAATLPYGPMVGALRGYLRAAPGCAGLVRPAPGAPRAAAARARARGRRERPRDAVRVAALRAGDDRRRLPGGDPPR